jgi:hypothetical protein
VEISPHSPSLPPGPGSRALASYSAGSHVGGTPQEWAQAYDAIDAGGCAGTVHGALLHPHLGRCCGSLTGHGQACTTLCCGPSWAVSSPWRKCKRPTRRLSNTKAAATARLSCSPGPKSNALCCVYTVRHGKGRWRGRGGGGAPAGSFTAAGGVRFNSTGQETRRQQGCWAPSSTARSSPTTISQESGM